MATNFEHFIKTIEEDLEPFITKVIVLQTQFLQNVGIIYSIQLDLFFLLFLVLKHPIIHLFTKSYKSSIIDLIIP